MTDPSLRERIDDAIELALSQHKSLGNDSSCAVSQAVSAVIAELGLRREWLRDGIEPVCGYCDDPPAGHHRYVTEWEADQ